MFRILFFFFPLFAHAFPLPGDYGPFPEVFSGNFNFESIVALSNCSGSLIRLEHAEDTDQALVLTNGHCLENGFPAPGRFEYRQPNSRRFSLMNSRGDVVGRLNATRLEYATMTGTDLAVYKVRETYAEILSRFNVRPLILSSAHPVLNSEVEIISGYWERGFRCAIEAFVFELREAGYSQIDSIRYSRPGCVVYGGTSGSPVIDKLSRAVVGVNNTSNESGRRCTMNNPCEVDQAGNITYVKDYSYGQQTYIVYSCLNANREIDLAVPGCLLHH